MTASFDIRNSAFAIPPADIGKELAAMRDPEEKMPRLVAESAKLDSAIRTNLKGLGFTLT